MPPVITLTTDFGHQDAFVGTMKGVMLSIVPDARLVDLCHETTPQDIVGAALRLEAALPYFPDGAVHLVVVDPGVGTERAAIAIETRRGFLVGPDNGILPTSLQGFNQILGAVRLTNPRYHLYPPSRTFHGRDIFAPCAAHLAAGVPLAEFGDPMDTLMILELPQPTWEQGGWSARILSRDRFGNLITNLRAEHLETFGDEIVEVRIGGERLCGVHGTYGDVRPGELVAYVGSGGRLEIGVRSGSAAERLGEVDVLSVGPREGLLSPE